MARVTTPYGTVSACVWDHAGGEGPLSLFWDRAGNSIGASRTSLRLRELAVAISPRCSMRQVCTKSEESTLAVEVEHQSFDEWWQPYVLGVGPAGGFVARLDPGRQARLRELCRERLPAARFVLTATAWAARGLV